MICFAFITAHEIAIKYTNKFAGRTANFCFVLLKFFVQIYMGSKLKLSKNPVKLSFQKLCITGGGFFILLKCTFSAFS